MISENIKGVQKKIEGKGILLVAVTKNKPLDLIKESVILGVRIIGENRV